LLCEKSWKREVGLGYKQPKEVTLHSTFLPPSPNTSIYDLLFLSFLSLHIHISFPFHPPSLSLLLNPFLFLFLPMEKVSLLSKDDDHMDLPPGFRFHPTDEELITHYLYKKVIDTKFCARAIGEVDLNKSEPWDLPCESKQFNLLRFFCILLC